MNILFSFFTKPWSVTFFLLLCSLSGFANAAPQNAAPTMAKSFSPSSIGLNSLSLLTITITNPNSTAITGAAFTDSYPTSMVNTANAGGTTTCSGGSVTAANNGNSVALTGGTVPARGSCKLTVSVTSTSIGSYLNSTGAVTSTNATSGTAATATLTVTAATPPLALYHFDESSWNGTAGEVADSSGNANNAQANNSASTASTAPLPPIATNPGTCNYGVMTNSTITNGYVQTPLGHYKTDFTVAAWIYPTNTSNQGQRIFTDDAAGSGSTGYGFSFNDAGGTVLRFFSRGLNNVVLDSTYPLTTNTWYFVAAVADITNKFRTLYVFSQTGVLLNVTTDSTAFTGTWAGSSTGNPQIGSSQGGSYFFQGNLDEVQVYPAALNQTALAALATQTHACASSGLNHILLTDTGSGSVCTAAPVTVNACNSSTPDTSGTCTGNTLGMSGFVVTSSGVNVPFTIATGSASTTVNVPVTSPQTVSFSISGLTRTASNPVTCWNGSSASCSFVYNGAGLLFNVPNHVSEVSQTVNVSTTTVNCAAAFANANRNVNFQCSYSNPVTGSLPVRVNGNALNAAGSTAVACDGIGHSIPMTFNASGIASTTFQYADVGNLLLTATYTGSASTGDTGLSLTGNDSFIAAPNNFVFSGITPGLIKAGHSFNATVTAQNSIGTTTANFGKESTPEGATLSFSKYQPSGVGTVNGSLTGTLGVFSGGTANSTNLIWSDVGTIDLTATLTSGSYLGSGLSVSGTTGATGAVGRFIPDHFTISSPMVTPACSGAFSYFGQDGFVTTFTLTAQNSSNSTTFNYAGNGSTGWAKLPLTSWSKYGFSSSGWSPSQPAGAVLATSAIAPTATNTNTWVSGATTVTAQHQITLPTTTAAPTTVNITSLPIDTDGVTLPTAVNIATATLLRNGRINLQNASGSELLDLPMPLTAEYWSGTSWIKNIADQCTTGITFTESKPVATDPITTLCAYDTVAFSSSSWCTVIGTSSNQIKKPPVAGDFNLNFKAPGTGNTGAMDITATVPSYLTFNWKGAGNTNPVVRATFGIYKGNSHIIYIHELY